MTDNEWRMSMDVEATLFEGSNGKWFIRYINRVGKAEAGWNDGPYRWRWLANFNRWLTVQHTRSTIGETK